MAKVMVAGPVIIEDGKVLLDISGTDDFWKFCGGKAKDVDIDLIATASRRANEELGIEVEIINPEPYVMDVTRPSCDGQSEVEVQLVHFLARRVGEIKLGEGVRDYRWFAMTELANEKLGPNIIPTLKHFGFM